MYTRSTENGIEIVFNNQTVAILVLCVRIVMAMASSSAMVTTYSSATQKSGRITESEDRDFLALLLNPLANILVTKLLNPVLTPGD